MGHEVPPFERTSCSCRECVQCCFDQPGACAPGDVERIADHLGMTVEAVSVKFWASPGALVVNTITRETRRIGTITPRLENGRCVFLDDKDRCSIHGVAPVGCSHFDVHMGIDEGQARGTWLAVVTDRDSVYKKLRETLMKATSWRPRRA